ncbi:hypothetical protein Kpol_448p10 [Vanderwaltozyma polyspora DSM 70294]|uniref:CN hydrolase domain-containing protein n=1 Tax=Vanderwaltozyma polyspora (strain ATCC 22028 / DSM 70294 / BCRC 21397 / CBS 2163 / NBRC 10782 / NRRL Y-8283 / UCD 57-17) TaxID=436907 RepID=A7TQY5_VANPO|nr:uncharacterized protein Kpol_448p10 [Vanderwaltozyma polyspora DSM 70294]EDO15322.1 hypothetical protein Kpol_448p10 [Vanderwaltozyma polyspora DSM 70294]
MSKIFRIAVGQLCAGSNLSKNLQVVKDLINQAIDKNARVIFFPEATDYLAKDASHSIKLAHQSDQFIKNLQNFIKETNLYKGRSIDVSIGVHMPSSENIGNNMEKVKNVLIYINSKGETIHHYQKIHLFDVDIANGPVLKESNSVQPGNIIPDIIETPVGKLGSSICYDIRFPELAQRLRIKGAEIICYPSAFTMKTGKLHWEALGKARALDTQCFIVMPGQQGVHEIEDLEPNKKRESWGHSMVINPWGQIIGEIESTDSQPKLLVVDLDYKDLNEARESLPIFKHKRVDIFGD